MVHMNDWTIWISCIVGLVALGIIKLFALDYGLNKNAVTQARQGIAPTSARSAPHASAPEAKRKIGWQRVSDTLARVHLMILVPVCMLIPPLPRPDFFAYVQTPAFVALVVALFALGIELELGPLFYRAMWRMHLRGWLAEILRIGLAVLGAAIVLTMPLELRGVRAVIIGNFIFCGGLTLQRELRRRVRTGDLFMFSPIDSLLVALQLVIMLNLAAMALTIPVLLMLWVTDLMGEQNPLAISLTLLAWVWTVVSLSYFVLYVLRLIIGARGFSWVDPPSWRVAIPHFRYKFRWGGFLMFGMVWLGCSLLAAWLLGAHRAREGVIPTLGVTLALAIALLYVCRPAAARGLAWLLPRHWPAAMAAAWSRGFSPPLADIVRVTYLSALFHTSNEQDLLKEVSDHARIRPRTNGPLRFAIIGDPGEGDDSQLYPANTERGAAKQMACQSIAESNIPAMQSSHASAAPANSIDFILISSDVIYPGGEMADYERAFYRPYAPRHQNADLPIYAIPGNHDWYDSLRGFLANFTYHAPHNSTMPWDWRPWRRVDQWRVSRLREFYRMNLVGGDSANPLTHQWLPFFEMSFTDSPLHIFALDNGVTGSIDALQYRWLEQALAAARAKPADALPFLLVLLGNPLYVGGEFDGQREAPLRTRENQESYNPREIYELLRRYHVDVVMGGDTHAYQRYKVCYTNEQGEQHTMHHIVNGGGGAYLSPAMDCGWLDFERSANSVIKLSRRGVYHPARWDAKNMDDTRADSVVLEDLYPSATEMYDKFIWQPRGQSPERGWRAHINSAIRQRYIELALAMGFTNALNHDSSPLLQSYVQIELTTSQGMWDLQIIPYMEERENNEQLAQTPSVRPYVKRQLSIKRGGPALMAREVPEGVV